MNSSTLSLHGFKHLFYRGELRSVGTQILVVAVVLLLSALLLLSVNVTKLQDSFAWVQRTDNVLLELSEVDARLVGNELTVRGYALTNDPRFLVYQKGEIAKMWTALDKLATTIDEPEHKVRYVKLRAAVKRRLDTLTHLTSLGPDRAEVVAATIVDPRYRSIMQDARAQVDDFRADELRVLGERQAAAAQQARRTFTIAIAIVVLAFVFSALGIAFLQFGYRDAAS